MRKCTYVLRNARVDCMRVNGCVQGIFQNNISENFDKHFLNFRGLSKILGINITNSKVMVKSFSRPQNENFLAVKTIFGWAKCSPPLTD